MQPRETVRLGNMPVDAGAAALTFVSPGVPVWAFGKSLQLETGARASLGAAVVALAHNDFQMGRLPGALGNATYPLAFAAAAALCRRFTARRHRHNDRGRHTLRVVNVRQDPWSESVASSQARRLPPSPPLSAREFRQLDLGLTIQKQDRQGSRGSGLVVMDVNAPPSLVLGCLESFDQYPHMIKSVRRAVVRARDQGAGGTTRTIVDYTVSKFSLGISVVHTFDKSAGRINFELDPSSASLVLQEASGFWHVEQAPGGDINRSRVSLVVNVRACRALPHTIVDYAAGCALSKATSWLLPYVARAWRQTRLRELSRKREIDGQPRREAVQSTQCPQAATLHHCLA
eukprot:CAMPEP_0117468662 /NCGR_PEP_ID=MMETSP0784-20121206/6293_1 /TAXON_ID=39447 /ORGANISM="" /LENGTH=344 /DNA_ID=CAMNT_0005262681 /DNA_START=64 /DNA_END=1098 /DNA_ORIENTATION=-